MAPATPLSPSELAYLSTSLSLTPPIRPDSRLPTQFRPLVAELDILPSCNGSARMVWADGAECIAGIKAEVTRTEDVFGVPTETPDEQEVVVEEVEMEMEEEGEEGGGGKRESVALVKVNRRGWIEVGVDVQGLRDDDPLTVFLAGVVQEGVFAGSGDKRVRGVTSRLKINDRYHWKLYIDILLITPPPSSPSLSATTHPLTLLSLTTHLALRSARIPLLKSEANEDPLFDDDWGLATPLYPPDAALLPPISLLVMAVGPNVLLDPSRDELCVAEGVWAISLLPLSPPAHSHLPTQQKMGKGKGKGKGKEKEKVMEKDKDKDKDKDKERQQQPKLRIVGIRTLESTPVPIEDKTVGARGTGGWEGGIVGGRGGVSTATVKKAVSAAVRVAGEVWEALDGVIKAAAEKT